MKAPGFWWRERPSLGAKLLSPVGAAYGAITARRMRRPGVVLPVPVICVGNLVAGGAGKTPTAIALARMLGAEGHRPAFLSRGYGRRAERTTAHAVLRVDPLSHDAAQAGDEPLLLAAVAPTYVSADRIAAGRQAVAEGATVLILDDGLQNPALRKTASVAVVDAATGIGNGLCIPAGPLRAPLAAQWPFVAALCLIGDGSPGDRVARESATRGRPVLRGHLIPNETVVRRLAGKPLYAFAGIGRPAKFFATLEASALDVRGRRAFPDHHSFSPSDCAALLADAKENGAGLVTTEKDRIRLPADFPATALPVSLVFDREPEVHAFLSALPRGA